MPAAPSILQVLMLSMLAQVPDDIALEESDVLIRPALPAGMSVLDWSRHTELFLAVYKETKAWIEEASRADHAGLKAVLAAGR
jgi:NTE family protein